MLLKTRITIGTLGAVGVVAVTLTVSGMVLQDLADSRFQDATLAGAAGLWSKAVSGEIKTMEANMSTLARNRDALKALQRRDIGALQESLVGSFNRLSTTEVVTSLSVHDTGGTTVYASDESHGDQPPNALVAQALESGKVETGIERDSSGHLAAALAFPIYVRGQTAGVALYAKRLDSAVNDLKATIDGDVFVARGDGAIEYATDDQLYAGLELALPPVGGRLLTTRGVGDITYSVSVLPVSGSGGDALAHLVVARDETQSLSEMTLYRYGTFAVLIGMVGSCAVGAFLYLGRSFRPLEHAVSVLDALSKGDTGIDIPVPTNDEVGQVTRALSVFRGHLVRSEELAEEQRREQAEKEERARRVQTLTHEFDSNVGTALDTVGSSAGNMRVTAETLSSTAEETSAQSSAVAAAAEQASANVQTVAAATEQLSSSIVEISRQVAQASEISATAVGEANRATDMVDGLDQAAQKIGEVVEMITDVAEKTNLLALNATIEAARAGDAGKGFAVVASEVKNLANQTAKATDEIGDQIGSIQNATQEAVAAIRSITDTISRVDEISTTIASAVEEQGAATQEIARNVEQAAAGTQDVTTNVVGISHSTGDTRQASEMVLTAANEVTSESERLRGTVEAFLSKMRAA